MRTKTIFFLIILLTFNIPFIYSVTDEGYGENDTYLGQIVDNYFNDDNINVTFNVVYNSVLDCMELENITTDAMELENFSLYTESDEGGGITVVTDTYVDMIMDRSTTRYIYYDFGSNAFGNWKMYGRFRQDYHNQDAWSAFCMMSNYLGGEKQHRDNLEEHIFWVIGGSTGVFRLYEYDDAGNWYSTPSKIMVDDTYFWFKMEKTGTLFEIDVYTTEALRDLEGNGNWYDDELTLTVDYKMRYLYLGNNYDDGLIKLLNMELYDIELNGTGWGYEEGYYTTIDMLDGDIALNLLYNASIVSDTNIKMEFLNGSGEWVNHNNVLGYDSLVDGFEAIDLRDVNSSTIITRVNMTSTDGSVTPRMNQLRYVTIIGEVENGDGGIDPTPSIILGIFLILVVVGLIYGVKK